MLIPASAMTVCEFNCVSSSEDELLQPEKRGDCFIFPLRIKILPAFSSSETVNSSRNVLTLL